MAKRRRVEKVLVFNGYGTGNKKGRELAAWVKRSGAKVAIVSELGHLVTFLEAIGRVYFNRRDTPHDTGIVVTGKLPKSISWVGGQLTKFIPRPNRESKRLWRDRWYVRVRIFNRVYYSIHANAAIAGPEGRWSGGKGAEVWHAAMMKLRAMIAIDIKDGRRVRVGGDFNFPKSDAKLSPNNLFDTLGMKWINHRVMWLAWHPNTDELVDSKFLGLAPGADAHEAILATFRKPRRRRRK